jgi:hypothetical protein
MQVGPAHPGTRGLGVLVRWWWCYYLNLLLGGPAVLVPGVYLPVIISRYIYM